MRKKTKTEWLQEIVHDYRKAGEPWPADRKTIAAWAISKKRWTPPKRSIIDQCATELAEAMRVEMEKDPQGRMVRANHCAKIAEKDAEGNLVQKSLWFDRENAPPDLMLIALQQRRTGILGDCRQLKTDKESFNDNNKHGAEINLSFNFEPDLEEMDHGTEYDPPPFDEDDGDDRDD